MDPYLYRLSTLDDDSRTKLADRVREADDVDFPKLSLWNYDPCNNHETVQQGVEDYPSCQECGILLHKHQRVAALWAYLAKKVLIADQMGVGKSSEAVAALTLALESGEFDDNEKFVIVVSSAPIQWEKQLKRMIPSIPILTSSGAKAKRHKGYDRDDWVGCLITYQTLINDAERLAEFNIKAVIIDDVDPLRNSNTKSAKSLKHIARNADRIMVLNGTPLQKRLTDLYSTLEIIGIKEIFGSKSKFEKRYIDMEWSRVWNPRVNRYFMQSKIKGYKNLNELKTLIAPHVIRRNAEDLDDTAMPALKSDNIYLEMYPKQRQKYEELRRGVLKIITEEGTTVKRAQAVAKFIYGAQICSGLPSLGEPDGSGMSVKYDWVERQLTQGALADEKVVVFIMFTKGIEAMQRRLDRHGIGYGTIWGKENDKRARDLEISRFWDDPDCRVLLVTQAAERSLNIQVARHLIAVDSILNASRMAQLAARIKRIGSAFSTVYVHNLFLVDSQEDGYLDLLKKEQAVSDSIWETDGELYPQLSPVELLKLIRP